MIFAELSGQNLNALVALEVLITECNVGRAARRMGITQSAMSHTLRQLRQALGDPLLARVGNRMVLTPFAEALAPRLRLGLGELDAILGGRVVFDPAKVDRAFTLAAHDLVAAMILEPLFTRLLAAAPHASLRIVPIDPRTLVDDLARGQCDAAFVPSYLRLEGVRTHTMPAETLRVVHRKGHPAFARGMTLDAYCACSHLLFNITGDGPGFVDHALAKLKRTRRVALRVPYLLAVPDVLAASDLIATIPRPAAEMFTRRWALESRPPPLELPTMPLTLAWHERFDADPAQRFFREQAAAVIEAFARRNRSTRR